MNNEMEEKIKNTIPDSLKDYVYIYEGNVYAKQKLPLELEEEYNELQKRMKELYEGQEIDDTI